MFSEYFMVEPFLLFMYIMCFPNAKNESFPAEKDITWRSQSQRNIMTLLEASAVPSKAPRSRTAGVTAHVELEVKHPNVRLPDDERFHSS